jgi:hypothetical protein
MYEDALLKQPEFYRYYLYKSGLDFGLAGFVVAMRAEPLAFGHKVYLFEGVLACMAYSPAMGRVGFAVGADLGKLGGQVVADFLDLPDQDSLYGEDDENHHDRPHQYEGQVESEVQHPFYFFPVYHDSSVSRCALYFQPAAHNNL